MWRNVLNIFKQKQATQKHGFGIVEVMISIVVLGFMYMALLHLQTSNDETVLRLRGRDGAMQVAQEILDSLQNAGSSSLSSSPTATTTIQLDQRERKWDRSLGGQTIIKYTPKVVVEKTTDYATNSLSNYETIQHVFAKQVTVNVQWTFKGTQQSIDVSGVIR